MPLNRVKELGKWPFCKSTMTPYIPEELLSLVISGISEFLKAPVVLMECKPCEDRPDRCIPNFIYPTRISGNGNRQSIHTYRYPELCKEFRKSFKDAEEFCAHDSACRGYSLLKKRPSEYAEIGKCHLGLNVCMQSISYLGQNVAVCTSGKFIQHGEEHIVAGNLGQFSGVIPNDRMKKLIQLTEKKDCIRDLNQFKINLEKETAHLIEKVENYFDTIREQNEWICREQITQALYELPNKIDDFSYKIEEILQLLQSTLSVEYLALFFAETSGDRVLPLTAQSGLNGAISSVHFNWRKAGLPTRDKFKLQEWIETHETTPDFHKTYLDKGIKGPGKEHLQNASYLIPYGKDFRGILLIGPWKKELPSQATNRGKDFIQSIGHLLVANALSKRAMAVSLQHDRRRDFIVAMTAHAIKHSLHTFWNSLSRVRHYVSNGIQLPQALQACDRMEEIIRTMSKNVDMSMSAPGTAVLPNLSKYEMEIERINLATLLYNCIDSLEDRATDKQITLSVKDNIDNLPLIFGDRYMLQLMFSNIIDNAIKYSRVNKEVRIYANKPNNQTVSIVIEDFGWGIPESDLNKIFEAQYRNKEVANKKIQSRGIGLGLFQAQEFAQLHNGKIFAKSTYISGESHLVQFTVQLPTT